MKQLSTFLALSTPGKKNEQPFNIATLDYIGDGHPFLGAHTSSENQFHIILITGGEGIIWRDSEKLAITGARLVIANPNDFDKLKLTGELTGFIMFFMPSFFDASDHSADSLYHGVYQIFARTRLMGIEGDALTDMQEIMEIMFKEFIRHNLDRGQILKRYFKVFLIHLSAYFKMLNEVTRQPRNNELLHNFMSLLEKHFRAKKMVADYADMLAVTPNYLNEVVKKLTGVSAGCHIRKRIALEAKRQAVYSNSCMKNIAYDLGFLDLAHFSKFFKNTTGINFSDFKKNGALLQPVN